MRRTDHEFTLSEMYQLTDELTLSHTANMVIPTNVRAFCGEVALEVLTMPETELQAELLITDAETAAKGRTGDSPGEQYQRLIDHLQRTRPDEQEFDALFAEQYLRTVVAEGMFKRRLADRFPELGQGQETYMQGGFLAASVVRESFGREVMPAAKVEPLRVNPADNSVRAKETGTTDDF